MSIESPQPQFNEEHKEAALRKSNTFKMRQYLQAELIKIKEKGDTENEKGIHWVQDHSAEDYKQAFDEAIAQHPDLLEIYQKNKQEALEIVSEVFDHIHQAA